METCRMNNDCISCVGQSGIGCFWIAGNKLWPCRDGQFDMDFSDEEKLVTALADCNATSPISESYNYLGPWEVLLWLAIILFFLLVGIIAMYKLPFRKFFLRFRALFQVHVPEPEMIELVSLV